MSITTSSGNRITAQDLTSIANFYRQWFGVDYTAPASGARITAADFNNLRQAIINGAGSNWSLNTFPGPVNTNDRIWAANWGDPVQNAQTINVTISANMTNLDVHQALINAGWNTALAVHGTITINSGIIVGSSSTGAYALTISGDYVSGSTIQIVNNGYIVGRGGDGGSNGGIGGNGGPAIFAGNFSNLSGLHIANNGIIGGGGGGGTGAIIYSGGMGLPRQLPGCGGAGYLAGTGRGPGTTTNGGGGNAGPGVSGGGGGYGGGLGADGGFSQSNTNHSSGGAAVVGNGYINWNPSGSIYGSVS